LGYSRPSIYGKASYELKKADQPPKGSGDAKNEENVPGDFASKPVRIAENMNACFVPFAPLCGYSSAFFSSAVWVTGHNGRLGIPMN